MLETARCLVVLGVAAVDYRLSVFRGAGSSTRRGPRSGSGESEASRSEAQGNPDALRSRGSDLKSASGVPEVIGEDLPPTLLEACTFKVGLWQKHLQLLRNKSRIWRLLSPSSYNGVPDNKAMQHTKCMQAQQMCVLGRNEAHNSMPPCRVPARLKSLRRRFAKALASISWQCAARASLWAKWRASRQPQCGARQCAPRAMYASVSFLASCSTTALSVYQRYVLKPFPVLCHHRIILV